MDGEESHIELLVFVVIVAIHGKSLKNHQTLAGGNCYLFLFVLESGQSLFPCGFGGLQLSVSVKNGDFLYCSLHG